MKKWVLRALLSIGVWLAIGSIRFLTSYADSIVNNYSFEASPRMFAVFILLYFCWAPLSLLTILLAERTLLKRGSLTKAVVFAIGLIIWVPLMLIADRALGQLLLNMEPITLRELFKSSSPFSWFLHTLVYALNFGFCLSLVYINQFKIATQRALKLQIVKSEIEVKSSQFQIQALQAQLSPHFLFNCLNTISSFARQNKSAEVINTTARLADLLRYAIEASKCSITTINDELDFTKNYIALQKIRFGNTYNIHIDNQLSRLSYACLPFTIQPFIENAFNHGQNTPQKKINLSLTENPTSITITIKNTKRERNAENSLGTGLNNLRERLRIAYGEQSKLTTTRSENLFSTTLIFPKEDAFDENKVNYR